MWRGISSQEPGLCLWKSSLLYTSKKWGPGCSARVAGMDGGMSNKTARQVRKLLDKALKDGHKLEKFARKVVDEVAEIEAPQETQYEAGTLARENVTRFFDRVEDLQYRTCFLLRMRNGLRRSELSGLLWQDVDFRDGILSVRRACIKVPSRRCSTSTPESRPGLSIMWPSQAVEALKDHSARQARLSGNGSFVFCNSEGTPLDPNQIAKQFRQVARSVGNGNLRLHDLRHTHATLLLSEEVNLKATFERMGHSGVAITAKLYSHVLPTVRKSAAHRFGDAWSAMVDGEKS